MRLHWSADYSFICYEYPFYSQFEFTFTRQYRKFRDVGVPIIVAYRCFVICRWNLHTSVRSIIHVRFYNLVTKRQKNIHPHLYRHTQCIRSPFFTIFIRRHGRRAPLRQPYVLYYIILYQVHEYSIIICTRYNIIYRIVWPRRFRVIRFTGFGDRDLETGN